MTSWKLPCAKLDCAVKQAMQIKNDHMSYIFTPEQFVKQPQRKLLKVEFILLGFKKVTHHNACWNACYSF